MITLKTLKDIEINYCPDMPERLDIGGRETWDKWKGKNTVSIIYPFQLRKEANKWIEYLNHYDFEIGGGIFLWDEEKKRTSSFEERAIVIAWIKHFFNIMDKELK